MAKKSTPTKEYGSTHRSTHTKTKCPQLTDTSGKGVPETQYPPTSDQPLKQRQQLNGVYC